MQINHADCVDTHVSYYALVLNFTIQTDRMIEMYTQLCELLLGWLLKLLSVYLAHCFSRLPPLSLSKLLNTVNTIVFSHLFLSSLTWYIYICNHSLHPQMPYNVLSYLIAHFPSPLLSTLLFVCFSGGVSWIFCVCVSVSLFCLDRFVFVPLSHIKPSVCCLKPRGNQ